MREPNYEKMFKKNFNKDWKSFGKRRIRRRFKNINKHFDNSYYKKLRPFNLYDYV